MSAGSRTDYGLPERPSLPEGQDAVVSVISE